MFFHTFRRTQAANNFIAEFRDGDWKKEWLDIFSNQVTSVKVNLVKRTVVIEVRQLLQGHIQDLIFHILDSEFKHVDELRVYPIRPRTYEYVFTDGELVNHEIKFDYGDNTVAVHRLVFEFDSINLHSNKSHAIAPKVKLVKMANKD